MKTIGVLTSGGDAPGMNAAIRAITRYATQCSGMTVYGVEKGYRGLIESKFVELNTGSVSNIIQRGGTILRSARCEEFKKTEVRETAIKNMRNRGIEGLIVIGGDGSFMGAKKLSEQGMPTIGIPGTIDNDIAYTDYTLGFDTACNTILDAISKIRDTMSSHERVCIIEVMGNKCGDLALYSGLGGGVEVIILPEQKMTVKQIVDKLHKSRNTGKLSGIIVLAEGAGCSEELEKKIESKTTIVVRSTVLGHIQRGGAPSMQDRLLGTKFGVHAVQLLEKGIGNRIVGIRKNKVFDMDIVDGLAVKSKFDKALYVTARNISG